MSDHDEKPESLFDRFLRHGKGQENNIWLHRVWTGTKWVTIPSYSSNPFAKIGVEAKREVGICKRTITRADLERLHLIGEQVRAFYGDAAVGELPPLPPKRKRTKRQAA